MRTNWSIWVYASRLPRIGLFLLLGLFMSAALPACKTKQKAAEKEAAEMLVKQTEQAKKDLISLLSDNNKKSLEEKEKDLQAIKDLGLTDPEVLALIDKVEKKLAAEREALLKSQNNTSNSETQLQAKQRALGSAMAAISNARSTEEANRKIQETLQLFSSSDAPVLIVISEENGNKDYDRPSTIKRYLDYLKDTENTPDALSHLTMNDSGLISEVELIKR